MRKNNPYNKKVKRTPKELFEAYMSGKHNMQSLGNEEGVSRERIRQLLRVHDPNFIAKHTLIFRKKPTTNT